MATHMPQARSVRTAESARRSRRDRGAAARRSALVFAGLSLAHLLPASPADAQAAPLDFAGIRLGSRPEDLQAHLDTSDGRERRVICSDQPDAQAWVRPARGYDRPSVITCGFEAKTESYWFRDGLKLGGDTSATVRFTYLDRRLFLIEAVMDTDRAEEVESSLIQKFGPATTKVDTPFQVKSGAVFPGQVWTWAKAGQSATLRNPDFAVKRLSVTLLDLEAEKRLLSQSKPAAIF